MIARPGAPGIGFDIDHTLLIDNKLERVAFLRMLDDVVLYGGKPAGTLPEEARRIDELLARQRAGFFTIDDAVRHFFAERGVDATDSLVRKYRDTALAMVDAFVVPLPGARSALRALRERKYPLAVLSNGWNPLQQRKAAAVGFDGPVLASGDIGAQKPDAKAFGALVEALGVPRASCWYVGDDPRADVTGALAAGLHAVWLDAEGMAYPAGAPQPTRSIHALDELLAIVQGAPTLA